ncbi:MAG: lactonase family protein [Saprospiraceae bacterium]|nr:lactonase family protein [Saprospiraceae bacterium]
MKLLVGTYTGEGSDGIYSLDFDPIAGSLSNPQLVAETTNPSFVCISKDRQYIYAVNETRSGMVSSFLWNHEDDNTTLISQQPSEGDHPCHIELSEQEGLLAVANYSSGNISIYSIDAPGTIASGPIIFQHQGSGPVVPNQKGARAHCVRFAPNGKFLYAVDLGIDQVVSYPIISGKVGESNAQVRLDPGDGPRHLIFHPNKDLAFVVNELSSTVVSLQADHQSGEFKRVDKASTLPEEFDGKNYCADIHITQDGKFLYASNRGHHSIAIFEVTGQGGLKRIAIEPVRGEWPRNFTLSPDDQFLLVANQNTNNVTVFEVNPATGQLTYTGREITISKPVSLRF